MRACVAEHVDAQAKQIFFLWLRHTRQRALLALRRLHAFFDCILKLRVTVTCSDARLLSRRRI